MDIIINIRPEFSNYNNPNHRKETVLSRLAKKFGDIDRIIFEHTAERIGKPTIEAVDRERAKYTAILENKKEAAA